MYGLTSTLKSALSGLSVAQDGLGTTANNVANAQSKGYTRKIVEQEARHVLGVGVGVRSVAISRTVDDFLETQLRQQLGISGRADTLASFAERAQGLVFGDPGNTDTGLAGGLDQLAQAIEAAAATPERTAQRMNVIGAAETFFRDLANADANVQALRKDADRRIAALIQDVNVGLQAVHDLNEQIARSTSPSELLDRRDLVVAELARQLDVSTHMLDANRMAIYGPGGQALLEYTPRTLTYTPASAVSQSLTTFDQITVLARDPASGLLDPATARPLAGVDDPALEGELGGLLHARDRTLPELSGQLQELGRMVRFALDAAHNGATALPPPTSLVGSRTDFSDIASFTGVAHLAIVDGGGAVLHTLNLDLAAAGTPAALAADLDAQLGGLGLGAAAIDGQGRFTVTLADPSQGLAIANGSAAIGVDPAGRNQTFGLSHYLGLNDFVEQASLDPTRLAVRPDIVAAPMRLASAMLDVDPAFANGSRLGGIGDNRGLQALAAALDRPVTTLAQGGLPASTLSMRGYVADVIGYQAVRSEQVQRAAANDGVLLEELEFRKAGVSGVNVDEEMAHLMVLQQAYTASARLITVTDELLQELLAIKR